MKSILMVLCCCVIILMNQNTMQGQNIVVACHLMPLFLQWMVIGVDGGLGLPVHRPVGQGSRKGVGRAPLPSMEDSTVRGTNSSGISVA